MNSWHVEMQVDPRPRRLRWLVCLALAIAFGNAGQLAAQTPLAPTETVPEDELLPPPTAATLAKESALIESTMEAELVLEVERFRSKLIRTKQPVQRFSVTDPGIVQIVQFSPTEFELIAGETGETTFTVWFGPAGQEPQILRYLVRVEPSRDTDLRRRRNFGELENMVNELFPNSRIQLIPVADKLIVRGQARDSQEAAEILTVLRGEAINQTGGLIGPGGVGGLIGQGQVASPYPDSEEDQLAADLISMLRVPGEIQIMLKVRVAELSRNALREIGADVMLLDEELSFTSLLNTVGPVNAVLDDDEVSLTLGAILTNSYSKILAEPNLVTLNGRPASFIAGGQFAVPTVVGVGGVGAVSTAFQGFGTQLTFTPTLIDKDRLRLQVVPTFSQLNNNASVNGIPGLSTRSVSTTVDLREGQWLAIAGLIQDNQSGDKSRVPLVGDIPILDVFFSNKSVRREETELIILVGPEIVHPMETEEMPLILPGMEITEPGDFDFFLFGHYEGRPHRDHRSTVWPLQRFRIREAQLKALKQAKLHPRYQVTEKYYVRGDHGFSD